MMDAFSTLLICITILFGIIAQIILLDIHISSLKGTRRILFIAGNLLVLAANIVFSLVMPINQYMEIYILVVHIPIFLIFWITTQITAVKVIFALFTAVFLIYPANMVLTILSQAAKGVHPVGFNIIYIAVCALILLVIYRFLKYNFNYLIKNYNEFSFIKLCFLPLAYYIANYWLGLYNYAITKSLEVFSLRTLIFILTLTAYILILDIAKTSREKEALQSIKAVQSLLLDSANHRLSTLQATQEQAAVYRHDMRHHLALISGYLGDGDIEKAVDYVRMAQEDIRDITPNRYCENSTVNLVLSSFATKAKSRGVVLKVEADLPQSLPLSETELCALLSNGLENAIEAAAQVDDEQLRKARISCQIHKGNLMISVKNSYRGKVAIENGLPQSSREGHGFGVRSMAMIADKYKGYCSFEAKDGIFTLRIALPLTHHPC